MSRVGENCRGAGSKPNKTQAIRAEREGSQPGTGDEDREFDPRVRLLSPCLIDRDFNIIAGHGRVLAAEELGLETVPCVFIEGLTEEQRRAYILADNRLTELGEWDVDVVIDELVDLGSMGFDVEVTGFEVPDTSGGFSEWNEGREKNDDSRQEGNEEYNEFLDKFETKKTTDDCYTPDIVYEAVASWVCEEME